MRPLGFTVANVNTVGITEVWIASSSPTMGVLPVHPSSAAQAVPSKA
jgi:hypothetical protein